MSKEQRLAVALVVFLAVSLPILASLVWSLDWSSFIPDLLVAGFTGVVVGLALWRVEVKRLEVEAHQRRRHEWTILRALLARSLRKGATYSPGSFATTGHGIGDIQQSAMAYPLALWRTQLEDPAIDRLIGLLAIADELSDVAEELDIILNSAVHRIEARADALVRSHTIETVRALVAPGRFLSTDRLSADDFEHLDEMVRQDGLYETALRFRTASLAYESALVDLRDTLDLPIGSY